MVQHIRLTNLGELALENILGIDRKYAENAERKKQKMARLWGDNGEIEAFEKIFGWDETYDPSTIVFKEGNSYYKQTRVEKERLPDEVCKHFKKFRKYGMVVERETSKPYGKIARMQKRASKTNPIKDVDSATVELTGLCNLRCMHCYRGGSRGDEPGMPIEEIKKALRPLLMAGISHIMITGGEPTLRRKELIELVKSLSENMVSVGATMEERMIHEYGKPNPTVEDVLMTPNYRRMRRELMEQLLLPRERLIAGDWNICNENTPEDVENLLRGNAKNTLEYQKEGSYSNSKTDKISIMSNGSFDKPRELVRTLDSYGATMQCSIDSFNGHKLNRNRGMQGLFGRLKDLTKIAKKERFDLHFFGHEIGGTKTRRERENEQFFNRSTPTKTFPGFLIIGNSAKNKLPKIEGFRGYATFGSLTPEGDEKVSWCDGFTEPGTIVIRPTGVVGNCNLGYAIPEQFGNLRIQTMAQILNNIQNTRIYKMFKDGRVERYQHEIDTSLFPGKFSRACEPMIVTLAYGITKERLMEQGMKENEARKRANLDVARKYGYQK